MGETSIPCREDTRDRLRDDKTSGVSWDRYLNDLLDAAECADDHGSGMDMSDQLDRIESAAKEATNAAQNAERAAEELGGKR